MSASEFDQECSVAPCDGRCRDNRVKGVVVSTATQATARWKGVSSRRQLDLLLNLLPWLMLTALGGIACLFTDKFLTVTNLSNVLQHAAPLGIMVVGQAICLMVGYLDLAVESTLILSAMFGVWLIADHPVASGLQINPYLGVVAMLVFGAAIGLVQGFLIIKVKANSYITTLGLMIFIYGLAVAYIKGGGMFPLPRAYRAIAVGRIGSIPTSVVLLICTCVVFQALLTRFPAGRFIYAVGGNKMAARASGVDIDRVSMGAFAVSGMMAALAGVLLSGRMNTFRLDISSGAIFEVIAAAVIGGVSLQGGRGNILGALGGILLLVVIDNIMAIVHFNPFAVDAIRGAIILAAALADAIRGRLG